VGCHAKRDTYAAAACLLRLTRPLTAFVLLDCAEGFAMDSGVAPRRDHCKSHVCGQVSPATASEYTEGDADEVGGGLLLVASEDFSRVSAPSEC
jgi:hypothetical protein